jgi:hypothetical protein
VKWWQRRRFERGYAKRSGVTVKWLHTHGRRAAPCDCDYEGCEGWQMDHIERNSNFGEAP